MEESKRRRRRRKEEGDIGGWRNREKSDEDERNKVMVFINHIFKAGIFRKTKIMR